MAEQTGSNGDALGRVLRTLTKVGVLRADKLGRFALTDLGEGLQSDVPNSRNAWARFVARPAMWAAWAALLHTVRNGKNAFEHVHGINTWQFRALNLEESKIFDAAMQENSRALIAVLIKRVDFSRFAHLVDVGGGDGTLLAGILGKHPQATGTLFDLPHVATRAEAVFATSGVDRCARVASGSFFDSVPAGGDAYLLKNVLHDWQDPEAIGILRSCRKAMARSATLVLVERIVNAAADADTWLSDLNMLVNAGGRERSLNEFRALLQQTGFVLMRVVPLQGARHAIEAVPA